MRLLLSLSTSDRGISWLRYIPQECLAQLSYVEQCLRPLWSQGNCFPLIDNVMKPLHLVAPSELKFVIVCKEPYAYSHMATGIPIETGSDFITPSVTYFIKGISKYYDGVNSSNFMLCYYSLGILVLNASFTKSLVLDPKLDLTSSHFALWTNFMSRFLKHLNGNKVPMLMLGEYAKSLSVGLRDHSIVRSCEFPNASSYKGFLTELENMIEWLAKPGTLDFTYTS